MLVLQPYTRHPEVDSTDTEIMASLHKQSQNAPDTALTLLN